MLKRKLCAIFLFVTANVFCYAQAGALREYVGIIRISYHQDVIDLMNKYKDNLEKRGYSRDARAIENYLQGIMGSGFVYVAPNGTNYILTNEHVVSNAETLSITFERQDGVTVKHDGLKILYADEEKDLAILYFENGARHFTRGLSFNTDDVEEGTTIYAAGFPAMGTISAWQFTQGIVSNASIRIPLYADSTELIGPYIQHTAQIDPGNSGGPLLVARQGVPANYAVVGINTLSARWRQAANFAIPITQVNDFINTALSRPSVNQQEILEKKVEEFTSGINGNRSVYEHISKFLSNSCIAINAEYAIYEVLEKAPRSTIRDIDVVFSRNPVEGMKAAVAWYIEYNMSPRTGNIKINTTSVSPNDAGGFTVIFNVNGTDIKTEWISEYGIYKMNTYGDITTGDKALVEEKIRIAEQNMALKTNWFLLFNIGYAHILENIGSSITASMYTGTNIYYGLDLNIGLENPYLNVSNLVGLKYPFRFDSFALIPFGEAGLGVIFENSIIPENINFNLKGGLMFTVAGVPGLVFRAYYTHNLPFSIFSLFPIFDDYTNPVLPNHGVIGFTVGYAF